MTLGKLVLKLLLVVICGVSIFPSVLKAEPIQPKSSYKIYMILWRGVTEAEKGFMEYFTRKNLPVTFEIRDCKKDRVKTIEFIQEIKETKPDLIYTFGTTISRKVAGTWNQNINKRAITRIPIVFNIVANPVASKIVNNLKSSDRNVTGTSHLAPLASQLAAIKSIVSLKRLAVIYNPLEKNSVQAVHTLRQQAEAQSFKLFAAPIPLNELGKPDVGQIPSILLDLKNSNPQLLYLPSDSLIISNAEYIVREVQKHQIPTVSATEGPIRKAGATFGLVARYYNVGRFAAYKAEQILFKNVAPRDIPIETLKRFSLVINMESALAHRFYPPISVLKIAEVINAP
jgi:ABC-type uncharacterized transport system substrate-binding protein